MACLLLPLGLVVAFAGLLWVLIFSDWNIAGFFMEHWYLIPPGFLLIYVADFASKRWKEMKQL